MKHCIVFSKQWHNPLSTSGTASSRSKERQKGRRPILSDSCSFATRVISNASRSIHLISSTSPRVLNVIIVPPSSVPREPFPLHAQLWPSPGPSAPPPTWSRDIILSRLPVPTHQHQLYDFHNLNTMPAPQSVTIDSHYSLIISIYLSLSVYWSCDRPDVLMLSMFLRCFKCLSEGLSLKYENVYIQYLYIYQLISLAMNKPEGK